MRLGDGRMADQPWQTGESLGMDEPYTPIACALHERLEFAILRRHALELSWKEAGEIRRARVLPLDVYARDRAEWLRLLLNDGREIVLRLDRIVTFRELPGG